MKGHEKATKKKKKKEVRGAREEGILRGVCGGRGTYTYTGRGWRTEGGDSDETITKKRPGPSARGSVGLAAKVVVVVWDGAVGEMPHRIRI